MRRHSLLLALALALLGAPASAQTITGCSSVPSNRVAASSDRRALQKDVDCFTRAKVQADAAIGPRALRIVALNQPSGLGDMVPPAPLADVTAIPSAIASNFDLSKMTGPAWETGKVGAIPPSSSPDVLGAFRFICSAGQIRYDDPIVYPGQPGKSHLHQFFGNVKADAFSTYASLRASGDSTCVNQLNRSAYWMPAMLSAGRVQRPDFVSIYYKRRRRVIRSVSAWGVPAWHCRAAYVSSSATI